MDAYEMIDTLSELALKKSRIEMDEQSYPYAFGMIVASLQSDLTEMRLSKRQMKVIQSRIDRLQKELGA